MINFHCPKRMTGKLLDFISSNPVDPWRSENAQSELLLPTGAKLIIKIDGTSIISGYAANDSDVTDILLGILPRLDDGELFMILNSIGDREKCLRGWRALMFAIDEKVAENV